MPTSCGSPVRRIERDDEARQIWRDAYDALTPDVVVEGHYAAVVARAVPQVLRLSLTYALLDKQDGKPVIRAEHLRAAVALWEYAQASAWYVFGDVAANVDLARLCEAVDKAKDKGLTRTEISTVFSNNKSAAALSELTRQAVATGGYVSSTDSSKPGRPTERLTKKPQPTTREYELNESNEVTPLTDRVDSSNSFSSSPRECGLCSKPSDRPGGGLCQACYDEQAAS